MILLLVLATHEDLPVVACTPRIHPHEKGMVPVVDISAVGAVLSSLKAAKDIGEAMIGLRDGAASQAKLIEFRF